MPNYEYDMTYTHELGEMWLTAQDLHKVKTTTTLKCVEELIRVHSSMRRF